MHNTREKATNQTRSLESVAFSLDFIGLVKGCKSGYINSREQS